MATRIPQTLRARPDAIPVATEAARRAPNVIREICYGLAVGITGGAAWKAYHLQLRRSIEEFYHLLENGKITVVVADE